MDDEFFPGFVLIPRRDADFLAHAVEGHPEVAWAGVERLLPSIYAEQEVAVVRVGLRCHSRETIRRVVGELRRRLTVGFDVAETDLDVEGQWYRLRDIHPHAVVDVEEGGGDVIGVRAIRAPVTSDFRLLCLDADFDGEPFCRDSRLRWIGLRWRDGSARLCTEYHRTGQDDETVFDDERSLLVGLQSMLDGLDPDIIAAYDADATLFPRLAYRAACRGLRLRVGREPVSTPAWPATRRGFIDWKHTPEVRAPGRIVLDLWKDARTDAELKRTDLSPREIFHASLGESDCGVDALWRHVNHRLPMLLDWSTRSRVPLGDVARQKHGYMNRAMIESHLTRRAVIPGQAELPWQFHTTEQEYLMENGGLVITPRAGLYPDVAVLDFASLFPRIFIEHNISPETINCPHPQCKHGGERVPFIDFHICQRRRGFYSQVFEPILLERDRVKARLRETAPDDPQREELELLSDALKLQLVSPYGWLQFTGNPLRSVDANRSIPAIARRVLLDARDMAETEGYQVIYADTDSLFISRKGIESSECRDFANHASEQLGLPLEFKELADWALFTPEHKAGDGGDWLKGTKKAYALLSRRDGVVVKGLEAARRDRAPIARGVQLRILEMLAQEPDDPRDALPGILGFVRSEAGRVLRGGAELGELPITAKLQRHPNHYANPPPSHVIAATKLADAGYQVRIGAKIRYIKLGTNNAAPLQLVEWPGPYHRESYAQDVLRAAHHVLSPIGVRPRDLSTPGAQASLLNYLEATCPG